MPRRLIFIALLTSMLMQVISVGAQLANASSGYAAAHAMLRWAGLQHHHHHELPPRADELAGLEARADLGMPASALTTAETKHRDQTPDSAQHLLIDDCLSGIAMFISWPATLGPDVLRPAPPCARKGAALAMPFIEGLRRPPRSAA